MILQDITLTTPNERWLNSQLAGGVYGSESAVINELIQKERDRKIENIRKILIEAEASGFCKQTPQEIIAEFKTELRASGKL